MKDNIKDSDVIKALKEREDIWLDQSVMADDGSPSVRGVILRRFKETAVIGPDSYHPYTRVQWVYVGQSFAVETDLGRYDRPLDKDQIRWREAFELAGGLYIAARIMADVHEELGVSRPEPWGDYASRIQGVR